MGQRQATRQERSTDGLPGRYNLSLRQQDSGIKQMRHCVRGKLHGDSLWFRGRLEPLDPSIGNGAPYYGRRLFGAKSDKSQKGKLTRLGRWLLDGLLSSVGPGKLQTAGTEDDGDEKK